MGDMIDWKLAGTVAHGVAGLQSAGDPVPFEHPETFAAESERLVSAYTGLSAATMPSAEAVGREGWIDANLGSMSGVLDPVVERLAGRSGGALGGVMSSAAGTMLAFEAGADPRLLARRGVRRVRVPGARPRRAPRPWVLAA